MTRAPAILAMTLAGVAAIGLLLVLEENVQVAPCAEHGAEGRLHFQTKNANRLGGSAADVRRAVARAIYLDSTALERFAALDWRERIRAGIEVDARPRHVVALPGEGEEAAAWALPGAYWAAFAGSSVVFLGRETVPDDALDSIRRLGVPVYVLAPETLVSERVVEQIARLTPVQRVAGDDLAEHAVRIAEYRDAATDFGWGREHEDLPTVFHFVIAAPADVDAAYSALPLAQAVAGAFLFAGDDGGVPGPTDRYLWSQRGDWFVTPSETSFRHLWLVGDRVSYASQGRLDLAVEKGPYLSKGPVALGPLETLGIVFLALGIAGFGFVLLHGARLLPDVPPAMRIAWAFTALLVPVGGVVLYLAAYRRPRLNPDEDTPKWLRPPAVQAAAATAMGFGYGAPLMIAIGYLFVYYGFPLAFGEWAMDGAEFVLGAGMPIMMAAMYVGAVLLAWPFVQTGMQAMMLGAPRREVAGRALGVTALSMVAVSLGMMSVGWFMLMERDPMMMPHEDEILWFVSLWLAAAVGYLVAWPLNWPIVRTRLKPGTM